MVQTPKYVSNAFFINFSFHLALSVEEIQSMYSKKSPTSRKSGKINRGTVEYDIKTERGFVKSLKKEVLERLLLYVTGSDNMPEVIRLESVKQNFRAPRARLCSRETIFTEVGVPTN